MIKIICFEVYQLWINVEHGLKKANFLKNWTKWCDKCALSYLKRYFLKVLQWLTHTSYLTDSYIVFTLKMESVSKNTIFGLKMIVESGLEKIFWNPSMQEDSYFYCWICDFGHFYEVRESSFPHGRISKIFFLDLFSPSFLGPKLYFWI